MPITEKQRAKRNLAGSSELAAILNMSPHSNAHDVYIEKVCDTDPLKENKAMEAGNLLEGPLLQFTAMTIGKVKRNQTRRVKGYPIRVNIDGIISAEPSPVEAKSVGILNPYESSRVKEWGEEMTSEVPDDVACQAHGHMLGMTADPAALTGYPKHCYVPTILGGRGFCMFVVPFDREFAAYILDTVQEFWTNHIEPKVPPPYVPHLETVKRIRRTPGEILEWDDSFIERLDILESRKWDEKAIKEQRQAIQSVLLASLGEAEGASLSDGRMLTYRQQSRTGLDAKKLQEEFPEVFEACQRSSTYRVMRIKKSPKALPLKE